MKKLFVALSLFAVVGFAAVPAYGLVGMPDAVPGTDVVLPFFLVEKTSDVKPWCGAGDNTLLTITEVNGWFGRLDFTVYDRKSNDLVNDTLTYTPNDVESVLVSDIINNMPELQRDQLEITFRGKTYYCGYIIFDNGPQWFLGLPLPWRPDNLIAHMYQLDLRGGLAAGVVIPAKERARGLDLLLQDGNGLEAFNASAYNAAEKLIARDVVNLAEWFRLMPRYFLHDELTGECYIVIWTSRNFRPGTIHINIYDDEENPYSITIKIKNEVNLINVAGIIPEEFKNYIDPDKPFAAGWIDISLPDINGDGFDPWTEYLGYSWQMAYDAAVGTNWSVLFDVHRDAGTF